MPSPKVSKKNEKTLSNWNQIENGRFTVFDLQNCIALVALSGCDDRSDLFVADTREFFRSPVSSGQELNYTWFEQAIHALDRKCLESLTRSRACLYNFTSDEGI